MNRSSVSGFEAIKGIKDGTEIRVFDNDIEAAYRHLRRRVLVAGVLKALRTRMENPRKADRKRVKARRAAAHRARHAARKAATDSRQQTK